MDKNGFQIRKTLFLLLIMAASVAFAACSGGSDQLKCAMFQVCDMFANLLPIFAFVLFILAGVAYAVGNFFGAETRAKAIGYAMNMLTGAIIGLILSIVMPSILGALMPTGATAITGCASFKPSCC
ncbi:Uncharacterised protein [uncultured archaeon]|nr:Uncharacterised protein [uncultured archaeon]